MRVYMDIIHDQTPIEDPHETQMTHVSYEQVLEKRKQEKMTLKNLNRRRINECAKIATNQKRRLIHPM